MYTKLFYILFFKQWCTQNEKRIICISEIVTCAELCICVFVHSADLRFLHLEKYLRCRFAHFVHDGFSHICRFAHLCFGHLQKFANMFCVCAESFEHVKMFSRMCARLWILVFHVLSRICKFERFLQKWRKSRNSENVRKCPEKSSRVPEWYTSGSWANAFDNTGWQKSPEYALIRIAAGAPDLAKSGQIRPRTAPDGKSSRIWRRFRFCSTGWNPVRSCFFLTRAQISDPSTCSRGASSSATESDTFCKCAHTSQNTRWKPPSGPTTFRHTVHTVHNRNRTVHTCAQPRHNSPTQIGREHIVHVLLLLGRREVRSVHEQ